MIIFNQMISIKTYTIQFSIFYSSGAVFKIAPFFVLFKIAPLYLSWPTISTCLKLLTKDPVLGLIWTRFISKVGQSWTPFIFILTSWYFSDRYFTIKLTYLTKTNYDIINFKKYRFCGAIIEHPIFTMKINKICIINHLLCKLIIPRCFLTF